MGGFRRLDEREIHRGDRITLVRATFESPDGHRFERDVVHHPGAVAVVPVVDDGAAVLLVRQYRAALGHDLLEIPAGLRDVEGEPPEATARRELAEEVGQRAGRIEKLCTFHNSPGFCDEAVHVFVAFDLDECENDLQGIEEAHMTVEKVRLEDAADLIRRGEITDAKTVIGLTLLRDLLAGPPR
ncbi:MAG TPA: NUDIX hydrolase [Acidimicrobiales bacterium]|nr:NUDIX hydrolase [Acidimicrobiales bacterium]